MRKLVIIFLNYILISLLLNSCNDRQSMYENHLFRAVVRENDRGVRSLELLSKNTNKVLTFDIPQLLVWDDGLPIEGGLVYDYNTGNIDDIFSCDSLYCIETDSIRLVLGLERIKHKRMDLSITNSDLNGFKAGDYTLYKVE